MQCYFSRIALVVLLCWGMLGCAPSPRNQKWYIAELPSGSNALAPASNPTGPSTTSQSLPVTAKVHLNIHEITWLNRLFTSKELRRLKSLEDLDTILAPENPYLTSGLRKVQRTERPDTALVPKTYNVTLLTHCDTEILKACIAAEWWPFVLLRHGNRIEAWLVMGYDDSGNISLQDPRRMLVKRSVTEFQREWKLPSPGQCVLIALEPLDKRNIRRKLQKYLPPAKLSQIHIRKIARPPARKC